MSTKKNALGFAPIIYTIQNLRKRIAELEAGIDKAKWKGEKLAMAKKSLTHFRYHLEEAQADLKTAKAKTRKRA